ncbi:hypothetical protein CHS0354_026936, partial [Potamilus streckersoni]
DPRHDTTILYMYEPNSHQQGNNRMDTKSEQKQQDIYPYKPKQADKIYRQPWKQQKRNGTRK